MIALTRNMALELAPRQIRVNAVCPGYIDTPLWDEWLRSAPDPEALAALTAAQHPLGRRGIAADVAAAVVYLASPGAAWVTGTNLVVDGGTHNPRSPLTPVLSISNIPLRIPRSTIATRAIFLQRPRAMKRQKADLSETLKLEFKKDLELFEYFLVLLNHSSPIRNVELMWAEDLELFDPAQRPE